MAKAFKNNYNSNKNRNFYTSRFANQINSFVRCQTNCTYLSYGFVPQMCAALLTNHVKCNDVM